MRCPWCDNNQHFYRSVYYDNVLRCSKCGRRAQIETSTVDDMPTPKQAVAVAERIIADHQHGVR